MNTNGRYIYKSDFLEIYEIPSTVINPFSYDYYITGVSNKVHEWVMSMYASYPPAGYGTTFSIQTDPNFPSRSIGKGYRQASCD
jgi:hypothetical protein